MTLALKALSRCALVASIAGCGAPSKFIKMDSTSSTDQGAGVIRQHFAYPGGCMDVDLPTEALWRLSSSRDPAAVMYELGGLQSMPGTDPLVSFARAKTQPGTSLQAYAEDYRKKHAAVEIARHAKLQELYNVDVAFEDHDLEKATLGSPPNTRDALMYADSYYTVRTDVETRTFSTLTSKVGFYRKAARYFVMDGEALLMVSFVSPEQHLKEATPDFEKVKASIRFGNCGASPPVAK